MKNIDKDSLNDALARNTLDDIPSKESACPPKRYGIFKIPAGRHGKQQSE